jgi:hypothetical protein
MTYKPREGAVPGSQELNGRRIMKGVEIRLSVGAFAYLVAVLVCEEVWIQLSQPREGQGVKIA